MNNSMNTVTGIPINFDPGKTIGDVLRQMGILTIEDAERVVRLQRETGVRFGEAAKHLGLVTEANISQALARQFEYAYLIPGEGNFPSELVAAYQPFSQQVEMLRAVRNQLMLQWFEGGRKALAISSGEPDSGTSLLVANLAVLFSQLGQTTLVIDANMRNPSQHKIFNLNGRRGLSDILADRCNIETFCKVEAFPGLFVLPTGTLPPNPQELLNRPSLASLLANLATRFDVILFDLPAFSMASDVLTVAVRVGGVMLVVNKNITRMANLNAIRKQLGRVPVEVVGTVLFEK